MKMTERPLLTSTLSLILTDLADTGCFYGHDKNGRRCLSVLSKGAQ